MSTPKTVKSYPEQYMDLLGRLQDNPTKAIDISFDTVAQARTFRLNFHSFRAAAEREGMTDLYSELPAIYVQITKEPPRATVMHKNYTVEAMKLKKALGKEQ